MNLKVDVKEKQTGSFSIGAGYSAVDQFILMGQIAQRNLFGRGQSVSLDAQLGASTNRYNLNFTEPWLFDTRISASTNIYNWERIWDQYTQNSWGGSVDFGHPLFEEFTRGYITYTYDDTNVTNIQGGAAQVIQDMAGRHQTSSAKVTLKRDSTRALGTFADKRAASALVGACLAVEADAWNATVEPSPFRSGVRCVSSGSSLV